MDASTTEDLYAVLGVALEATEAEIKKAYRTLAVQLHPDKNPDDPLAGEKFAHVFQAYDLLKDEARRKEYDAQYRARNERKRKLNAQDDERKRMRAALEENERKSADRLNSHKQAHQSDADAKIKLAAEIASLRKMFQTKSSTSSALPAEFFAVHANGDMGDSGDGGDSSISGSSSSSTSSSNTISVKWDKDTSPPTEALLQSLFEAYGVIDTIAVSTKQALVSFGDAGGLENAIAFFGNQHNLKLARVGGSRPAGVAAVPAPYASIASARTLRTDTPAPNAPTATFSGASALAYEQQTFARMKALIEQRKQEKLTAAAASE